MSIDRFAFSKLLFCSSMALAVSACESSGGTRMASVGQPFNEAAVSSGAGDSSTGNASSGDGTSAAGDTSSADGTTTASDGTAGGGTTTSGGSQGMTGRRSRPILVTAGNAVLDAGDRVDAARGPLTDNLPTSAPITGTVTQVLHDTGQALVRSGDGSSYLVDGLTAAPGSAVTIAAGDGQLVGGPGSNPLLGVSVLSPAQTAGSIASVGVASNGTLLTANAPGQPALAGVPAAVSGATGNLANATVGNAQLAGGGQPATLGVSALSPTQASGTVVTAGVASGGALATVNGASIPAPATGSLVDANAGGLQLIGDGQPAVVGVSALSPTQTSGSLLTAGVASGGSIATAGIAPPAAPSADGLLGGTPSGPAIPALPAINGVSVTTPVVTAGGSGGATVANGGLGLH